MPAVVSPAASSPFSTRTDASSPEPPGQSRQGQNINGLSFLPSESNGRGFYGFNGNNFQHFSPDFSQRPSPSGQQSQQGQSNGLPFEMTASGLSHLPSETPSVLSMASASGSAHHGGTRSEPPRRQIEVEELPVVNTSGQELAKAASGNLLLLQGDPQYITKQRVETAIRVILDLLRMIPASSTSPKLHPTLAPYLLRDPNGTALTSLERVGTFRSIRLQAGTTTKAASKKQIQAGPTPKEALLYLETAVYMSGENGRRVYACRRCRMREAKRRQNKDASRKKPAGNTEPEPLPIAKSHVSSEPPSQDYITGENPDMYDPHRAGQRVEEPPWNPNHPDWRHEVVLFNSAPEVQMKDGSCVWLPFRVICYGKCHGEKVGFRIKFTLRTHTGDILATSITGPVRITDDHKTDAKTKPRLEGMTQAAQAPVPRARKHRQSTTSSHRVSPSPSDVESVQSMSEAGAMMQKQTPSVRTGKPYERPQQHDTGASHSFGSLQQNGGLFDMGPNGTVSPGALRQPAFGFNTNGSAAGSIAPSAPTSSVTSPSTNTRPLDSINSSLFNGELQSPNMSSAFASLHSLEQKQHQSQGHSRQPSYPRYNDGADVEMSNAIAASLDNIFDTSSHASMSSFNDDAASVFSANLPEGSLFSDSGVVPDDMQGFLDFTGGQGDAQVTQPSFYGSPLQAQLSPTSLQSPSQLQNLQGQGVQGTQGVQGVQGAGVQGVTDDMLAQFLRSQSLQQQPQLQLPHQQQQQQQQQLQHQRQQQAPAVPSMPVNAPLVSTIIPAEGPMAGGTTVAIIGANFTPGIVVMFGDRIARLQRVDPTFIQCQSPPAATPGIVEVSIAGAARNPGSPPIVFKYNMMDTDLMMLALQVQNQYNGATSDAAYRLAQQVAAKTYSGSDWSASEVSSPSNGPSPADSAPKPSEPTDLQLTVINFLAGIDVNAPGSLRLSGFVNHRNDARQTLLHIATTLGFHRLVRRLVVVGAQLDLQDVNGYTALGLASLMGQAACVRVLIEAGASYDRPTLFGEMPLDLAKIGDHSDVEALLLSAVWSTKPGRPKRKSVSAAPMPQQPSAAVGSVSAASVEADSEIDDDNPSDSEEEVDRSVKPSRRLSHRARGKQRSTGGTAPPPRRTSLPPSPVVAPAAPVDDPPPYDALPRPLSSPASANQVGPRASWMSRTLSAPGSLKLPGQDTVWDRLSVPISHLFPEKTPHPSATEQDRGWVAFPAPSWDTLSKMTSPEEVKLFTQAMAAAAFNAVVQSGATTNDHLLLRGGTSSTGATPTKRKVRTAKAEKKDEREREGESTDSRSGSGGSISGHSASGSQRQLVKAKSDRMLYLFWLPILLFVGFWLLVTALPLATGLGLIYAKQITRAIKQRI